MMRQAVLFLVVGWINLLNGVFALPADGGTSVLRMSQDTRVQESGFAWTSVSAGRSLVGASPCSCAEKVCGCCQSVEIPKLGIETKACANVTFLSEQIGVTLTLSFDGKVLFSETVSVKNPKPICADFPGKFGAKICAELYKLSLSPEDFEGCVRLEAKILGDTVATVDLGCFKMPFRKSDQGPASVEWSNLQSPVARVNSNGECSCSEDRCGCCQRIRIKELRIDKDFCILVQFLSAEIGVSLALTIDGRVVFNETLSLTNPPPICVHLAGGKVCVVLHNVAVTPQDVSGCVRLEAEYFGHTVAKFELGCFRIPLRLALYGRVPEGVLYLGDVTVAAGGSVVGGPGLSRLSPENFPLTVALEPYLSGEIDED